MKKSTIKTFKKKSQVEKVKQRYENKCDSLVQYDDKYGEPCNAVKKIKQTMLNSTLHMIFCTMW